MYINISNSKGLTDNILDEDSPALNDGRITKICILINRISKYSNRISKYVHVLQD